MALIETYAGLYQSVIDASEDDSTEFSNFIITATGLAESRLVKEVFKEGVASDIDISVNSGDNKITKPTGYRLIRSLSSITGTTTANLEKRPRTFITEYWPDSSVEGTPKYYGDFSGDEFIVAPTPDVNMTYRVQYVGGYTKLSDANQTNFFVTDCPNALFYAVMIEMMRFAKDTENEVIYENSYQGAIQGLLNEAKRERGSDDNHQTPTDDSANQ